MKRKILTTLLTASLLLSMPGTTSVLADTHDAKTELLQEDIADVPFDVKEEDSEGSLSFIEEKGYAEGAYVTFNGASTDKYHAYVSTSPDGDWTPLDDELIRYYVNGTWRVDALGLTSRTWYYIKVQKDGGESLVSAPLYVYAHDRSGFAWAGGGTASGAYNEDGSLKENAKVIYVTDENKDDLRASITVKGIVRNCTGLSDVMDELKNSAGETDPVCIRFIGNVHDVAGFNDDDKYYAGDMVIQNKKSTSGITIEGVGNDATANGWGIRLKNSSNVEVRNLGFMNCDSKEGDDVGLQQDNDHIWIHNCDLFYGEAGTDEDQVKGDGAMDCKRSTYSVFSYNHFWDSGKSNLLGLNEDTTEGLYVTYHHNWYDHSDSRHPRTRYYSAHVYNNYYDGNAKYGSGATLGASVFMDSNYFRNCHYPMMISLQGTDRVYAGGTFSNEDGGMIKAYGNRFAGKYTFVPYARAYMVRDGNIIDPNIEGIDPGEDFDAYPVKERTDTVPGTVESKEGGNHYNNFDTDENVDLGVDPENIDKADYVPET
ncbi:MAG: hypothetical protein II799_03185, partial [Lachnospiraceae bacterium]|nr:hypothetical protein [Lachnospiraceae bacterium]